MPRQRKILLAGVVVVAVVAASVFAFAQWLGTGTGSGRGATTAVAATVNPVDCAAEPDCVDLYPGYTEGDVYFTITNTNPYEITFTDMTSGAVTVDTGHAADCPADSISVAPASGLTLVAPANSTTGELSIGDVVSMNPEAPDGCQGASFDIELTLSGEQSS